MMFLLRCYSMQCDQDIIRLRPSRDQAVPSMARVWFDGQRAIDGKRPKLPSDVESDVLLMGDLTRRQAAIHAAGRTFEL